MKANRILTIFAALFISLVTINLASAYDYSYYSPDYDYRNYKDYSYNFNSYDRHNPRYYENYRDGYAYTSIRYNGVGPYEQRTINNYARHTTEGWQGNEYVKTTTYVRQTRESPQNYYGNYGYARGYPRTYYSYDYPIYSYNYGYY